MNSEKNNGHLNKNKPFEIELCLRLKLRLKTDVGTKRLQKKAVTHHFYTAAKDYVEGNFLKSTSTQRVFHIYIDTEIHFVKVFICTSRC